MPKIAIIDKCPSKAKYNTYFDFDFDHYHLSSVYLSKLLKKDVDIDVHIEEYDFVITVGAEATKMYTGQSVTQTAGTLIDNKFLPISNPAMLSFRPEGKPDFERSVAQIKKYISGEITNSAVTGDFKGIDAEDEALYFLMEVLEQPKTVVAMDTETTSLYPREGYILGISIAYKLKHGRYISTDVLTDEHVELLQQIIDKHQIVFHNRKFDEKWLSYHFGLKFKPDCDDTMLEHYILDETQGTHGLKALAIKYTLYGDYDSKLEAFRDQYCAQHGVSVKDFTYDAFPFPLIAEYAAIDTAVTLELHNKFMPLIEANPRLKWVYDNILIPGTVLLMEMEEFGIPMDIDRLKAAEVFLDAEILEAKKVIYNYPEVITFEQIQGKIFNPNSVQQLRKLLFDHIGLTPTGKLTATKAISTDAEVLEELSKEHSLPAAILKVRKLIKIKNTYISKIIPELDADGKIRTNFNLSFTTSGRLSSSGKLNAQQFPRDNAIVKACIKAPDGYVIINQDLKTAEMYVAAVVSKDKALQQVFISGGDFHSGIAKQVFKLKCLVEEIKKLFPLDRQAAKAVK